MEETRSEKLAKGQEVVRSLTDEQRASIRQLLDDNPPPGSGNVGDVAPVVQSTDELERRGRALEAQLPELNRWQDAISAGMRRILTPEQYALYQDSLPSRPVGRLAADVGPQTCTDCYYAYIYAYYAQINSYYQWLYAYYAYYYVGDWLHYDLYVLAYDGDYATYYGYLYGYYADYYCYYGYYAYYSWWWSIRGRILEYYSYHLAYEIYYYLTGDSYSYWAYDYSYYAWLYNYYATYYAYYCYYD
jgi:hypothetical protein